MVAAFITGLFGSLHCAGMCGPLALSFNVQERGNAAWRALWYNLARIFAYTSLGAFFGVIGLSFSFAGLQQAVSIVMGVIIILFVLLNVLSAKHIFHLPFIEQYTGAVRFKISKAFAGKGFRHTLALGFFNGLLPCGLVYLALAASVAAGSIGKGMLYMAMFGLGTLPLMFSFAAFGSYMGFKQRLFIRKYLPAFSILVASLLILRGLNLGIPYISPRFNAQPVTLEQADAHQFCKP